GLEPEVLVRGADLDARAPNRRELGVAFEVPRDSGRTREIDGAEVRRAESTQEERIEPGFRITEEVRKIPVVVVDIQIAQRERRRARSVQLGHLTTIKKTDLSVRVDEHTAGEAKVHRILRINPVEEVPVSRQEVVAADAISERPANKSGDRDSGGLRGCGGGTDSQAQQPAEQGFLQHSTLLLNRPTRRPKPAYLGNTPKTSQF